MKIGILLPTSKLYPSLMVDFAAGARMALAQFDLSNDVEFVFESIQQGTDKNIVLNAVNKLVLQHQTDVNILFSNYLIMEDIASSLNALQTPLIVTNMGGNPPVLFDTGEYLFLNSFGLWESAIKSAQWAVEKFGPKVAHGSYFYEAGYGIYSSFCKGLQDAGGEIIFNQVSEFNPNPDDFSIFEKQMDVETPNFLYMLYSERDAVGFLNKFNSSPMNGKYPVVTSGVLISDEILEKVNGIIKDVYNISSWDDSDDHPENILFKEKFESLNGKKPNYFALLGYECVGLVGAAMNNEKWGVSGFARAEALKTMEYVGPRGNLRFDETNSTVIPHNVYSLNEHLQRVKVESIGTLKGREDILTLLKMEASPAGWFQPYLCQ